MEAFVGLVLPIMLLGTVYVCNLTGQAYVLKAMGCVMSAYLVLLANRVLGVWVAVRIPWHMYFSRDSLSLIGLPLVKESLLPGATEVLSVALVMVFMMGFRSVVVALSALVEATHSDQLKRREKAFLASRK